MNQKSITYKTKVNYTNILSQTSVSSPITNQISESETYPSPTSESEEHPQSDKWIRKTSQSNKGIRRVPVYHVGQVNQKNISNKKSESEK